MVTKRRDGFPVGDFELRRPAVRPSWASRLAGGAVDGNARLTAMAGAILLVLLAALGVTIIRNRQLISEHLFLGLLLIGPVAVKLGSTGYRFVRYYTFDAAYRQHGPPLLALRGLAPFVVLTTLAVFASGVALLLVGPGSSGSLRLIHKASFILWLAVTSLHVIGHIPDMNRLLRRPRADRAVLSGAGDGSLGRGIVLAGGLVGGLVLALLLLPDFAVWASTTAFHHSGR
jgi:hypothetical protein